MSTGCGATQMAQEDEKPTTSSSGQTAAIRSLQSAENDAFTFDCPSCHYRAKVPGKYLGKSIKCPQCATTFTAEPSQQATSTGNTVAFNTVDPGTKSTTKPAAPSNKPPEIKPEKAKNVEKAAVTTAPALGKKHEPIQNQQHRRNKRIPTTAQAKHSCNNQSKRI